MAAFRGPASVSGAAAAADSASWVAAIALCDEGDVPVPPDDRGQRATASDPRVLHAANVLGPHPGLEKASRHLVDRDRQIGGFADAEKSEKARKNGAQPAET